MSLPIVQQPLFAGMATTSYTGGRRQRLILYLNILLAVPQVIALIRLMEYVWIANGPLRKIDSEGRVCFLDGPGAWLIGRDYKWIQVGIVLSFIQLVINILVVLFTPSGRASTCFVGKLGLIASLLQISASIILAQFFFNINTSDDSSSVFDVTTEFVEPSPEQPEQPPTSSSTRLSSVSIDATYYCFRKQYKYEHNMLKLASILWTIAIVLPMLSSWYVLKL